MNVTQDQHPRGIPGLRRSGDKVREGAVEDRKDPKVREWVLQTLQASGNPQVPAERMRVLFQAAKQRFHYAPDPLDAEYVASTAITLCLEGAELCYRGGDCDDAARTTATLALAVGLNAAVVHQEFYDKSTDTYEDHLIGAYFDPDFNRWVPLDLCYFNEPDQKVPNATAEHWVDALTGHVVCDGKGCPMQNGLPPDNVVLKARPLGEYVGVAGLRGMLGDAGSSDPVADIIASWGVWLDSVDKDMVVARDAAMAANAALQKTRQALDLPAVDTVAGGGEGASPPQPAEGQWTQNMQDSYDQIIAMATTAHTYAQEALAGKRKAFWAVDAVGNGQIALEKLPDDKVQLIISASTGLPAAINLATGQPMTLRSGQAGSPLLIAAAVVAGVVESAIIVGGVYLITKQLCEAIETKQQMVAQKNLTDTANQWVQSGKATPDQATKFVQAIGNSTPASSSQLEAKTGKPTFSESLLEIGKMVTIGGIVVVVIGGAIWALDRYGPAPKRATARA